MDDVCTQRSDCKSCLLVLGGGFAKISVVV
jgi:hypothetical protein